MRFHGNYNAHLIIVLISMGFLVVVLIYINMQQKCWNRKVCASIIASVQECQVLLILAKYHVLRILLHILVIRFARIGNGEHQLLPQHTLFFELVTIAVFRTLLCKYRYKEQQYKLVILVISKMQSLYIIRENTFIRMIKRDARRTVIIDAQHVAKTPSAYPDRQ